MTDNLASALAAFQAKLPPIVKTKTAKVKTKDGGSYQYSYADLAEVSGVVLPALGAVGLSFTAKPTFNEGGKFVLAYRLLHACGDSDEGEYPLPQSGTAQEIGSAITYARRYALCSIVGVAPDEDDDGAAASEKPIRVAEKSEHWDPHEQETLRTAWQFEIEDAKSSTELDDIAKRLVAAKKPGAEDRISPATFDHLKIAVVARRGEINGKAAEEVKSDGSAGS